MPSYLAKSKKDLKPKAAPKRSNPVTQVAVRASVERQLNASSQTPQPQARPAASAQEPARDHGRDSPDILASAPEVFIPLQPQPAQITPPPQPSTTSQSVALPSQVYSLPFPAVPQETPPATEPVTATQSTQSTTTTITNRNKSQNARPVSIAIPAPRRIARAPSILPPADVEIAQTPAPVRAAASTTAPTPTPETAAVAASALGAATPETTTAANVSKKRKQPAKEPATTAKRQKTKQVAPAPGPSTTEGRTFTDNNQERPVETIEVSDNAGESATTRRKRGRPSAKDKRQARNQELINEVVADATQISKRRKKSSSKEGSQPRQYRRRATPEGAAAAEINPAEANMADMCVESRTGKKSRREEILQKRDEEARVKKQEAAWKELQEIMEAQKEGRTVNTTADANVGAAEGSSSLQLIPAAQETPAPTDAIMDDDDDDDDMPGAHLAPSLRIVNGQIVQDETSLRIDLHKSSNNTNSNLPTTTIHEDALSRHVNAGTHMKRARTVKWTPEMNTTFFNGLRQFGTDFQMLALLFPDLERRQVKLKFSREERQDPEGIKRVLLAERVEVDLAELQRLQGGREFGDPKQLDADMEEDRKRLEEDLAKEKEAGEEAEKRRREEADAEAADVVESRGMGGGEEGEKENDGGRGRGGRRKKEGRGMEREQEEKGNEAEKKRTKARKGKALQQVDEW